MSPSPAGRVEELPCVCGRLRRAARALTQLYDDVLAPSGLRITQYSLLRTLARRGTLRMTELATVAMLDRTALSRNLEPLAAQGLVRIAAGVDARTREISLTRAGEAALARALPHWRRSLFIFNKFVQMTKAILFLSMFLSVTSLYISLIISKLSKGSPP